MEEETLEPLLEVWNKETLISLLSHILHQPLYTDTNQILREKDNKGKVRKVRMILRESWIWFGYIGDEGKIKWSRLDI